MPSGNMRHRQANAHSQKKNIKMVLQQRKKGINEVRELKEHSYLF